MKNECIIVPYHYVHNTKIGFPKVYTKNIRDFKKDIRYLSKKYKIISLRDYVLYLNDKKDIPEKTCILTFDDGLADHYDNVYPILRRKNIPATFFVSTLPLQDKQVLPVQMLQCLLAEVEEDILVQEYTKMLQKLYPKYYSKYSVKPKKDLRLYIWYSPKVIGLKSVIRQMSIPMQRNILKPLFEEFIGDEETFWSKLYMNYFNIKDLLRDGFEIGCHGYSHSTLINSNLKEELVESKSFLEKIYNTQITSFSIPYGTKNEDVIYSIKNAGYHCCLNSEFKVNSGKTDPFNLTRIDPMLIGDKI